jgi:hypothetical protein
VKSRLPGHTNNPVRRPPAKRFSQICFDSDFPKRGRTDEDPASRSTRIRYPSNNGNRSLGRKSKKSGAIVNLPSNCPGRPIPNVLRWERAARQAFAGNHNLFTTLSHFNQAGQIGLPGPAAKERRGIRRRERLRCGVEGFSELPARREQQKSCVPDLRNFASARKLPDRRTRTAFGMDSPMPVPFRGDTTPEIPPDIPVRHKTNR